MAFHHIDDRIIIGTIDVQRIAAEVILVFSQRHLLRCIRILCVAGIGCRVGHRTIRCLRHIHRRQLHRCDARLIFI